MSKPLTTAVDQGRVGALRALFRERGHTLLKNAKNQYIDFEVRTSGKSIFTLYTSGKLVTTVREGDGEGLLLADDVRQLVGGEALPSRKSQGRRSGGLQRGTRPGLQWIGGADETGTGEILGAAILGGALLPTSLADPLEALVGSVETKSSRAASGWARLATGLAELRSQGLVATILPVPNRLFDRYSKNAMLDLAYVRLMGDLLAGAGLGRDADLASVELAIDDYGIGALLETAAVELRRRGAEILIEHKADDSHLAARAASVAARSARSREMEGLNADVPDGPVGTGNPGHRDTRAWLRARAHGGRPWPSFVKTSFRTIADLERTEPAIKLPMPAIDLLVDDEGVEGLLSGALNVTSARWRLGPRETTNCLHVDAQGRLVEPGRCPAYEFLPLLAGGFVLDLAQASLELLDALLDRDEGLLAGTRVLVGPTQDPDDPAVVALARAHAHGCLHIVPTAEDDPVQRAHAAAAVRVTDRVDGDDWRLVLRA